MPHARPSPEEIDAALERVVASAAFARSERSRALLRYLVEQERAGNAGALKGFSVAVDVLGRDSGFDPSTDAVVRVQAGRLRDLLRAYYAAEGADDSVRIDVPRGSYVPTYRSIEPEAGPLPSAGIAPADDAVPVAATPSGRQYRARTFALAGIGAALAIAAVAGSLVAASWQQRAPVVQATAAATTNLPSPSPSPSGGLRPAVALRSEGQSSEVRTITSSLRAGLAGFDTVDFLGTATQGEGARPADYSFTVMPGTTPATVLVELRDADQGKVLLSREMMANGASEAADRTADLLTMALSLSGVLYADIRANGRETPLTRCLLLGEAYYGDQNEDRHKAAYSCFEALARDETAPALVFSELGSLQLEAVTDNYTYLKDVSVDTARAYAYLGVKLAPASPYTHRAMGFLLSRYGQPGEAVDWMRKAYELNRYDLSIAASYGYSLVQAGDYAEGTTIMHRAVDVSSGHPSWWDYVLFLGCFMQGDMEEAAIAAGPLVMNKRFHYLAARLIVARHSGRLNDVDRLIGEINRDYPKLALDPRSHFERAKYPSALTDKLVNALQAAGLGKG